MTARRYSEIALTAHPPERRRGGSPVILPCGCCCCCCCCLHSIGGIVGGLVGTAAPVEQAPRPMDPSFPFPFRRDELDEDSPVLPVGMLYWMLVCFGLLAVALWEPVVGRGGSFRSDDLVVGLVVGLLFLPAIQLGASLVAATAVLFFYPAKRVAAIRLGKITLWSFVGAFIGAAMMGMGCILIR
jgi:hypothetical protein